LSSAVAERLHRLFDLVSALAGVAVLVILGPGMLVNAATAEVPEEAELIRVNGVLVTCRQAVFGATLRLQGYPREFHSQLDSCDSALAEPGRAEHVSLFVVPSDLEAPQRRAPIPSFGFVAEGVVVHEPGADLVAARLDRVVLLGTGFLGTATLVWLGWVARRRGALASLLSGTAPARPAPGESRAGVARRDR
jgi:hypothetical protein